MKTPSKSTRAGKYITIPKVAILVDTSITWGRRVITGVHNYTRIHHAWQIFVEARGLEEQFSAPVEWAVEGVVARVAPDVLASGCGLRVQPFPMSGRLP